MRKSALLADTLRTAASPAALGGGGAEDQSAIFFNLERLFPHDTIARQKWVGDTLLWVLFKVRFCK